MYKKILFLICLLTPSVFSMNKETANAALVKTKVESSTKKCWRDFCFCLPIFCCLSSLLVIFIDQKLYPSQEVVTHSPVQGPFDIRLWDPKYQEVVYENGYRRRVWDSRVNRYIDEYVYNEQEDRMNLVAGEMYNQKKQ